MRTRTLILVLAALCLSVTTALAQNSTLSAGTIATSIDASASVYGLPSGNGSISAAEQALGTAISQEIVAADQSITVFAQGGKANSDLVNAVEGRVAQSFDPRADAISNAVDQYGQDAPASDPRADGISNAVDQYGQDSGDPPAIDPRAQAISDAVNQYGQDNANSTDPRAQAISDAVAQYGQGSGSSSGRDPRADAISNAVAQYGQDAVDPRAQAISNAVEQYGREQGPANQTAQGREAVNQAIERGVNSAVDGSSVKHKSMVKKRIQQLVQIEVPSTSLPINGNWRVKPFSVSSSGHCILDNGDNGGPDGDGQGEDKDPGRPLCGYANTPDLPFITWDGEDLPYLPGTGSIYSPEPSVSYDLARDRSGKAVASVKVTTTREYRVVSPSEIHVHLLIQEDGGCSLSADYVLELVTADESVCVPNKPMSTPEPTSTPPPETQGPFRAGLPIFNDENDCDDTNRPPAFDQVFLRAQAGGVMMVDYGAGQQMTFAQGWGNYDYDSGNANGSRLVFSVAVFDDGSGGSIFWSKKNSDGKMCVASVDLTPENADGSPISTPAPEGAADGQGTVVGESTDSDASSFVLPTGHFTVTWAEYPGLACPAALAPQLPRFPEATISKDDSDYTLDAAGVSYPLVDQGGNFMDMVFNSDNSGFVLSFNGFDADGNVVGSYMVISTDGTSCLNSLTLKAA